MESFFSAHLSFSCMPIGPHANMEILGRYAGGNATIRPPDKSA